MIQVRGSALPIQKTATASEQTPLLPEDLHMAAFLRVYPSCQEHPATEGQPATVRVTLGDLLPLVALAHRQNYVWLQDFLEDEVVITEDLFEVLGAFRCTRPSA
jgi:hypothetical protein